MNRLWTVHSALMLGANLHVVGHSRPDLSVNERFVSIPVLQRDGVCLREGSPAGMDAGGIRPGGGLHQRRDDNASLITFL